MRKRCVLIRHGKTAGNYEKRYIGNRTDEDLAEAGIREIDSFKERYRTAIPDAFLVSSPLKRAVQTAKTLFDDREIKILEDLKEMDFGVFEGKNYEELKEDPRYRAWIDSGGKAGCPEGENMEDFSRRSMRGFEEALRLCPDGKDLCIVCHGGNIMAILYQLCGDDYYDYIAENLGGYILDVETDDEGIHIISYDRFGSGMLSGSFTG